MTNMSFQIGENLKARREAFSLSQTQIASFIGLDQSMVCKLENGTRQVSADILEKLSSLYGVPVADLCSSEIVPSKLSVAFRSTDLTADDLETIAIVNKVALNLREMHALLGGDSIA